MLPVNFNQVAVSAQSLIISHSLSVALETKERAENCSATSHGQYFSRNPTMYDVAFGIKEQRYCNPDEIIACFVFGGNIAA